MQHLAPLVYLVNVNYLSILDLLFTYFNNKSNKLSK